MAAACFMPRAKGRSDMATNPKPKPVNPCTKPARVSVATMKGQFIAEKFLRFYSAFFGFRKNIEHSTSNIERPTEEKPENMRCSLHWLQLPYEGHEGRERAV